MMIRAGAIHDPFIRALSQLERTLTAGHIAAFPVWCRAPDDDAASVCDEISRDRRDFSHVPLRDGNGHVRWIARRDRLAGRQGRLGDHAEELAADQIVDANHPLRETLVSLAGVGFLLVRSYESGHPDGISGIINHADVQKTAVRMLLFAQLTEIEARLRFHLTRVQWEDHNKSSQFVNVARKNQLKFDSKGQSRIPLINYLNPKQLLLLARALEIPLFPTDDHTQFARRAARLCELRNDIAHTNDFEGQNDPLAAISAANKAFLLVDTMLTEVTRVTQASTGC